MDENYLLLINAVAKRAAEDYLNALCITKGKNVIPEEVSKRTKAEKMIFECEHFFNTSPLMLLCRKTDGGMIIQKLQREACQYGYNYRAIMKSRNIMN